MGRLSIAILFAVAAGCTGTIDEGAQTAGLTPAQQIALSAWLQGAEPAFHANTCDTCHAGQMLAAGAPAYLLGDTDVEKRDAAIATLPPVINLGSPRSSRVLVKGLHEGPVLDAPNATQILLWIQDEHDARPVADLPTTAPFTMTDCSMTPCQTNSIDLTAAGAAGTITFTEMPIEGDDGMPATDMAMLTITAGAAGLHVVHPLFGTVAPGGTGSGSGSGSDAGGPAFDAQDRFFNVDMELAANATLVLGSEVIFSDFDHVNPIVVQFDTLTAKD